MFVNDQSCYIYRYIKPICRATRWSFYVLFFLNCCRNYSRMWCFFCIGFFSKWEFFSDVEMLSDMSVIPIWSTRSLCSCSGNHIFLWEIFHFDLFSFWIEAQFSLLWLCSLHMVQSSSLFGLVYIYIIDSVCEYSFNWGLCMWYFE